MARGSSCGFFFFTFPGENKNFWSVKKKKSLRNSSKRWRDISVRVLSLGILPAELVHFQVGCLLLLNEKLAKWLRARGPVKNTVDSCGAVRRELNTLGPSVARFVSGGKREGLEPQLYRNFFSRKKKNRPGEEKIKRPRQEPPILAADHQSPSAKAPTTHILVRDVNNKPRAQHTIFHLFLSPSIFSPFSPFYMHLIYYSYLYSYYMAAEC